jgi:hypothetical protein
VSSVIPVWSADPKLGRCEIAESVIKRSRYESEDFQSAGFRASYGQHAPYPSLAVRARNGRVADFSSKWKVTHWKSGSTSAFLISYTDRAQPTSEKRVSWNSYLSTQRHLRIEESARAYVKVAILSSWRSSCAAESCVSTAVTGCWWRAKGCFGKNRRSPRRQPRVPC